MASKRKRSTKKSAASLPIGWAVRGYLPTRTAEEIEELCRPGGVDAGISNYVRTFLENSFETCQSCQGAHYDALSKTWSGKGHCYPEPTIEFYGGPSEGFRALALCRERNLPVSELRRVWSIQRGEPVGPHWAITFSRTPLDPAER